MPACPICKKPVPPRETNPAAPFCCERCKLLDLGKWLGEEYRVPGPRAGDGEERPASPEGAEPDA